MYYNERVRHHVIQVSVLSSLVLVIMQIFYFSCAENELHKIVQYNFPQFLSLMNFPSSTATIISAAGSAGHD